MSDHEEPQYRTYHQPDPDDVELRQPDEDGDGVFTIRMPVVTTGEVRNEGDEPFTADELEGMAAQIDDGQVPVFLDHGTNPDLGGRYSATEKAGVWRDAAVETRDADGESQVTASAVLMDPETLPGETGSLREALSVVKAQAERGIPLASSIGWREDEAAPGGNDVMETSIVGIPADPRTTSHDAAVSMARDVLADSDLPDDERERLVAEFRAAVMGSDGSNEHDMSDDTTESGDEPDDTHDETDGIDADAYREQMLEMQRTQTETLNALSDALREDDEDDDEDDTEENEGDTDDEDDEGEQSAADGETRTVEVDGEERAVDDVVAEHEQTLETLRANGIDPDDLDVPEPDEEQGVDEGEADQRSSDAEPSFSFTEDTE